MAVNQNTNSDDNANLTSKPVCSDQCIRDPLVGRLEVLSSLWKMSSSDWEPEPVDEQSVAPTNCRRKGTTIRNKERDLIKSIVDLCDKEARQKCLLFPLRQATKRAALYAKVSERTIKRLRDEVKTGTELVAFDEPTVKVRRIRMAHKFASNLSFMFQEVPSFVDRYQAAKDAGFKAVESGFPLGFSAQQVAQAKEAAGIQQILINVFTGDTSKGELGFAAIPGKEKDFKDSVDLTIQYAKALDCNRIHVMAGKVENPTAENHEVYEKNLKYAAEKFAAENIVGLIEPINSITVPNYYLNDYKRAVDVIEKVNSPNLKLLMDIFHAQQITGKITKTIEDYFPHIGHVQIAQVPSRNEPDVLGEVDFHYIFSLLERLSYKGYVGLEYKPLTTTSDGLKWIKNFGLTL